MKDNNKQYIYNENYAKQNAKEKSDKAWEQIRTLAESFEQSPDQIAEYLSFASKFAYQYSVRNTQLIYMQNRGAAFCQSYDKWKKDGYHVLKGQHGMSLFVPTKCTYLDINGNMIPLKAATEEQKEDYKAGKIKGYQKIVFKIGTTFDVAQTDFPPEKYPELFTIGFPNDTYGKCLDALIEYAREELHVLTRRDPAPGEQIGAGLYGYYIPSRNEIFLRPQLQDSAALSTFTHELGHALMHSDPKADDISEHQIEFEADCVRIMLMAYIGAEISVTAKNHLADHYKCFKAEVEKPKKEAVIRAMEAAGYTYDRIESADDDLRFFVSGGNTMHFGNFREAEKWLEGVVFDDPAVTAKVQQSLHPESIDENGNPEKKTDPMLDSFNHVFQIYKGALPKINYYLEKAVPDVLPENVPINDPNKPQDIPEKIQETSLLNTEPSKENKPRMYADQSITAEVLSNRSSFKEEMTGLLRLKEERCDSKFVSGDDRPSLPIVDGPTALAETLEQLPRGVSLVLCTSID